MLAQARPGPIVVLLAKVLAERTHSATTGCKLTSIRADNDNVNIERQAQSSYRGGRTHKKERGGWGPSGSLGAVVSWMRLRKRKSPSAARASSNEQCKTPWIVWRPSACKPCWVSTGPRFTSASQTCCSCSGDTSQVYNPVPVSPSAGRRGRFPICLGPQFRHEVCQILQRDGLHTRDEADQFTVTGFVTANGASANQLSGCRRCAQRPAAFRATFRRE